ncbi:MAG TPA: glutamate racemase [candidate division Zixibacteria bacterium]|nr:glutamate racemase [candidate division Zixibacteria bacterium]
MQKAKITDSEAAIGVFDSGVGGLTVVKEIFRLMPNEKVVYFGDTARFPYGTRSPERVKYLALENSKILLDYEIKVLVVACNTASSVALDYLDSAISIPIVGVVKPGAYSAARATRNGRIGIIGTNATIESQSYQKELSALNPQIQTVARACPLFVALAEEGWTVGPVARMVAETYLADLRLSGIDALILACTHYPLLKSVIEETLGSGVRLVDSAVATVEEVRRLLDGDGALAQSGVMPNHRFMVSDAEERFRQIGERFLDRPIQDVQRIEVE